MPIWLQLQWHRFSQSGHVWKREDVLVLFEMSDIFSTLQIMVFSVSEEIIENVPWLWILLPLTGILETYVYLF